MKFPQIILLSTMVLLAVACSDKAENSPQEELSDMPVDRSENVEGTRAVNMPPREPILGRLEQMKEHFYQTVDFQTAETVNLAIDEIRMKNLEQDALKLDDKIPMFTLPNATGEQVNIADLLEEGPVVIMFYRGPWSQYCELQLREMNYYVSYMKEQGASLVAISPTTRDSSLSMKERFNLDYYVLSDSGNVVANNFGLVYKMPEKYKKMMDRKHHFAKYYGDNTGELPITMTYIVDQSGTIRFNYGDSDYRVRAEPHEIVDMLTNIRDGGRNRNQPPMQ